MSNAPYKQKGSGPHLSATRIAGFEGCNRKWVASNVRGFDGGKPMCIPPSDAMLFGTEYHRIAENWLKYGTVPPNTLEGATFRAAIVHLPAPMQPWLQTEVNFESTMAGHIMQGQADAVIWRDGKLTILDHKTTSSLRWSPDSYKLARDNQANIYAKAFMDVYGVDEADLIWVYVERAKTIYDIPAAKKVTAKVTRAQVEAHWAEKEKSAAQMLDMYNQAVYPKDVEPNENYCYAYNKECAFKADCDDLKGFNMTTLAELRALSQKKKAEADATSKPAPPPVVTEEATAEEPLTVEAKPAKRASKALEQKAVIGALEAIKTNLEHLTEMQKNMQEKYDLVLNKLLEDLQ